MAYAFNDDKSKCQFGENAIDTLNDIADHGLYQLVPIEIAIPSTASNSNNTVSVRAPGRASYAPVAVAGWTIYTGTRNNYFNVWKCYIDPSDDMIYFAVRNGHSSSAASGTVRIYVLYMYAG